MVLLKSERESDKIVFIIGQGLVGTSIQRSLKKLGFTEIIERTSTWDDIDELILQIHNITDQYELNEINSCELIWSAGKSGFNSTEEQTSIELNVYKRVINEIKKVMIFEQGIEVNVHLISSAGGLFEGQRNVNYNDKPSPKRPYGKLKLNQEIFLSEKFERGSHNIYRPASLYGKIIKGHRFGLISTLIHHLITHKVTTIYGNPMTLRDYIWVDDLGRFVADKVVKHKSFSNKIYFLVSGRPFSIFQVIRIIEKNSKKRCLVEFHNRANESDITFAKNCVPSDFKFHALDYMIPKIYKNAVGSDAMIN